MESTDANPVLLADTAAATIRVDCERMRWHWGTLPGASVRSGNLKTQVAL